MPASAQIVVVTQHYPPDPSTTADIVTAIATHLAATAPVLVLSGTPGSAAAAVPGGPRIVELRNRLAPKQALFRRMIAEAMFSARAFFAVLRSARRGDVVLTVTAPFMLPYAAVAAAKLRGARSIVIMHDVYPDVLVLTGLLKAGSPITRLIHACNGVMLRALSAVVIIGEETRPLLRRYRGVDPDKIHFIPNWATLPAGVRPVPEQSVFRAPHRDAFVLGLSGNLGFTHDPDVVFEAARLLRDDPHIRFLLSGWGIGFARLQRLQAADALPNVTLIDRVPAGDLDQMLAAADAWIIPYRADVAGVSVPSRLYNLLAVGRPILIVSDADSDAAQLVRTHRIGWGVCPGDADGLAAAIRQAARAEDADRMRERAVAAAAAFTQQAAMRRYTELVGELLR